MTRWACRLPVHADRRLHRHRLLLSAVHGAAAVRQPGQADHRLLEAAYDLGAKPWQAFLRITLPLSKAGIIAGCMLVMIPAVGEFVIPEMLGGSDTLMIGRVLWNEFFNNRDWPGPRRGGGDDAVAAGADPAVQPFPAAPLEGAGMSPRRAGPGAGRAAAGFAFLYLPIVLLMFYSFNARGWRRCGRVLHPWYSDLLADRALMDARGPAWRWRSGRLRLGGAGHAGGDGDDPLPRFRGKPLFGALVTAPLVMPEVIIGLSLLLLLVSMGAILGFPARAWSPSGSPTSPSPCPSSPWWCPRACRSWTCRWKKRRWTWAPTGSRCSS
jgi:ABC-type spermidine/putrescine transport system permease subunit II